MPSALHARDTTNADEYELTLEEAAALVHRSSRTIRRWTEVGRRDRGLLPAAHTIHGVRLRASELLEYARPVPTSTQSASHRGRQLDRAETSNRDQTFPLVELDDVIARVVASAPPLTAWQKERLAVILGGGAL